MLWCNCVQGQIDTLYIGEPWSVVRFKTTTLGTLDEIVGPSVRPPRQTGDVSLDQDSTGKTVRIEHYYYGQYIDTLHTIFIFSSVNDDYGDSTTLSGIEFYTHCPALFNSNIRIDTSVRTEVERIFGQPEAFGIGGNTTWCIYQLYVNNSLCRVMFYYDAKNILRKILIEQIALSTAH